MSDKRANIVLNYIRQKKEVTLKELCALFPDYHPMTLRRDLTLLQQNGYIRRTRGGAVLCEDGLPELFNYELRSVSAIEQKRAVAVRAAELLCDGSSVYFDAGTTVLELARILPDMPLFVTTNGPTIALELMRRQSIEVVLTGGSLNKNVQSVSGHIALSALEMVNVDTAFMGAAGLSEEHGFSNALYNECELKRKVIACAKRTVMLLDSGKIGLSRPYTFATLSDVDVLITNRPLPEALSRLAEQADTQVIVASGTQVP